jgi:hypothetical protein
MIQVIAHYLANPSYVYLLVFNSNPVDVYLTESYLDWPMGGGIHYLDWLYFNGYYFTDNDTESPNTSAVIPSRVLEAESVQYLYAGFAVQPDNWKDGHWYFELTFNGDCVVPHEFWYVEPTPVPTMGTTPTFTPGGSD